MRRMKPTGKHYVEHYYKVKCTHLFHFYLCVSWAVTKSGTSVTITNAHLNCSSVLGLISFLAVCLMPCVIWQWYSLHKSNLHKYSSSLSKCQNGSHWGEMKSSLHNPFLFTGIRVAQILVVAHKPHPPGLCILETGMTFCHWLAQGHDASADSTRTRLSL